MHAHAQSRPHESREALNCGEMSTKTFCFRRTFLIGLVVISVWFTILSLEQYRLDQYDASNDKRKMKHTRSNTPEGAELRLQHLHLNSSVFMQALNSPRRPMLVRFDWYSRKVTPVHIGYGMQFLLSLLFCISLSSRSI